MNSLDRTLVAVVTSGASWATAHVEALGRPVRGSRLRAGPDSWSILSALDCEAIVIADVEAGVERWGAR